MYACTNTYADILIHIFICTYEKWFMEAGLYLKTFGREVVDPEAESRKDS